MTSRWFCFEITRAEVRAHGTCVGTKEQAISVAMSRRELAGSCAVAQMHPDPPSPSLGLLVDRPNRNYQEMRKALSGTMGAEAAASRQKKRKQLEAQGALRLK